MNWPLRAKMVLLLVVASLVPLVVAAWNDIQDSRKRLVENTASLLAARADHVVAQLDTFHRGYQRSVRRIASLPHSSEFFRVGPDKIDRVKPVLKIILDTFPSSDSNIRGTAILDLSGIVKIATEEQLVGKDLSFRPYMHEVMQGAEVISNIHFAEPEVGLAPTIAYVAPVFSRDHKMVGFAALWVRADAFWRVMKESNELAGPQSFAVMFDQQGIRIAHTYSDDIVFHPGGRLAPAVVDAEVAERRFGDQTRALLEDVRPFPEQFDRALSSSPDLSAFRGFAPVNQKWNYGVARRFKTTPWTVFYMIPEDSLNAPIAEMTRKKVGLAAAIILAALATGALFAAVILKPVGLLAEATKSIASGNLATRVSIERKDELGGLGASFNEMAGQIEIQATALQQARTELEARVQQRTAELAQTTKNLEAQMAERERAERKGRESLQMLQAIINNSTTVVYAKDLEGRYLLVNRQFAEIFHLTSEHILGKTDYDLFPRDVANAFRAMDQSVLDAGEVKEAEELAPQDGALHTYLSIKCPLFDPEGKPYAVCGISTDITERKKAEVHSAWLASFPERNPNPVIELNLEKRVVDYMNPVAREFFPDMETLGLDHPWLVGILGAAEPLFRGNTGAVQREVSVGERCYSQTLHYLPQTRQLRVYSSDITERKAAEDALANERNLLRLLISNLPACIYVKDHEGRFLVSNAASVRLVGLASESEALGKTVFDFFPPEIAQLYDADDRLVLTTGKPVIEREEPTEDSAGDRRWLMTTKLPFQDSRGNRGLLGISQDITERKLAQERLQAQVTCLDLLSRATRAIGERQDPRSIFQIVLRSLEEDLRVDFAFLCLYDQAANTLTVTNVGSKSLGLAMELAMPAEAHIPIDQNGLSRCVRGELVYEPDVTSVPFPFPQRLLRGGLRAVVIAPLLTESKVFGVLISARQEPDSFSSTECEFLRQLSEHVALAANQAELHSALQQAYDDLHQTQQAVLQQERLRSLGQMASGIAHDINNALSPVALYTESLLEKEPQLSARGREQLETIRQAISDVAATISRMREFYRHREPQLTLIPVRINGLIQQVLELTRAKWCDIPLEQGVVIHLQSELAAELPPMMGIESEIREALTNLIFNAVDAMPHGGTLTLRTHVTEKSGGAREGSPMRLVHVEVVDTGVGMDEETRRRCLEPFFTTKGERGTGLGLAMVYGVLQRHGGEIEIESIVDQGTTVRLSFVAQPANASAPDQDGKVASPPSRLRILLVDDDPILLKSLRDTLEGDGHEITTANGGQLGIDTFRRAQEQGESFAVVITDLGMPAVDGRKVAAAVKDASPATSVILLTGWGQRLIAESETPAHVDHVLSKPPKLGELRAVLARHAPAEQR